MYLEHINGPENARKLRREGHRLIITMEDSVPDGGYGQRIASCYGMSGMKVLNPGISKAFHSEFKTEELLAENGISVRCIQDILCRELGDS